MESYPDHVIPPKFGVGDVLAVKTGLGLANRIAHQGEYLTVTSVELDREIPNYASLQTGKIHRRLKWGFKECCDDCRNGKPHVRIMEEGFYLRKVEPEVQENKQLEVISGSSHTQPMLSNSSVRELILELTRLTIPPWRPDSICCGECKYTLGTGEIRVKPLTEPESIFMGSVPYPYVDDLMEFRKKTDPLIAEMKKTEEKIITLTKEIREISEKDDKTNKQMAL